ncbi:MAG: tRNA uridine-5-carboxymethylaminomethyl(34) synthesis GTPase MnmE [Elusimicrobia bacterium]|nr:tRNA uridine-5-carboxymethylaminomethyl(34) synthesis GTPase MnmE [Elusimicrobiota bacterium]
MSYNQADTIAALATPLGTSAVGIVRISGSKTFNIISKIFTPKNPDAKTENGKFFYGYIKNTEGVIDDVIVSFMRAPKSYTGEDSAEISAHGNPVILNAILKLIISLGARIACPGEFTYRAFLNNKLSLTQAEAVSALIESKTLKAARANRNTLDGKLNESVNEIKQLLLRLIANIEAGLDFEVESEAPEMISMAQETASRLCLLESRYQTSNILRDGLNIAITGRPNAGKSSLFNALLGRERAIVTPIAGTTTDTINEHLQIGGVLINFTDTAGINENPSNAIEALGIEKAQCAAHKADLALFIIDSGAPLTQNDINVTKLLNKSGIVTIAVLNKSDLPQIVTETDLTTLFYKNDIKPFAVIKASAKSGEGLGEIKGIIEKFLKSFDISGENLIMINTRHHSLIVKAQTALETATRHINAQDNELACLDLNIALSNINEILGITESDNILETVFANFCVGK